ncbi:hypothetical protein OPT61_g5173 [Boeremia exigua]|uniref:Uncharacterized protein n=1 Tax=Boeremia exigua TaxID=749465 RepID=A0ACC2IBH6_9PLEO|nr:hypothetical protein OPT61_g5173 [Boeremia exigua]
MEKPAQPTDATQINTDEPYQYDTLPQGEFFRYLLLQPGPDHARLKCSLHTAHLRDTEYEAISYVWGTEIRDHDILCDGRKLKITKNLHDALQKLRHPIAVRKLWADSICIHQQNTEEKAHQVANMGRIYATAQQVLLHMGLDPSNHAPDVASLLKDMRSLFDHELAKFENPDWNLISFLSPNDPLVEDKRWQSLEVLFQLPWFKRGWVVREAGLARECLVIWGDSEFRWTDLMWVAIWLRAKAVAVMSPPPSRHLLNTHIDAYWDRHNDVARVLVYEIPLIPNRLLDYISLGRYLHFKDRRDSIYAFFDLADDSAEELRSIADYTLPLHLVFRNFTIQYLRTTGDVSILDYIVHDAECLRTDLPSWVPVWNAAEIDEGTVDSGDHLDRPNLLSRTGINRKPEVVNEGLLKVHGVICDSVAFITETLQASTTTPKFILQLWLQIQNFQQRVAYSLDDLAEFFAQSFIRLTINGPEEEWELCVKAYVEVLEQLVPPADVVQWDRDHEHYDRLEFIHKRVRDRSHNKKFFVTKNGYFGLAPAAARQGDLCGVAFGWPVYMPSCVFEDEDMDSLASDNQIDCESAASESSAETGEAQFLWWHLYGSDSHQEGDDWEQYNAMGLEKALLECGTFASEEDIPWRRLAKKHGVVRSTLTRKWRGETRSREEKAIAQQKLTLQQEEELVKYIKELTSRHIPPTREMIQNFASSVAKERVSESWVTHFINNYSIHLISQYSTGMDADRHNADSYAKSFEATGIAPLQPNVILQRFARPSPQASDRSRSSSSTYSGKDWLKIETLLRRVAKGESSKELRKVSRSLHHISIQNQLLHHEIAGLKEVLKTQKKHKKKSKALDFQEPEEYHSGAVFYSPHRVDKARQYKQVKQLEAEAEEARKAEMAELRRANKLYKERVAQEKREQRAREKEERDQVNAKKAEEVAERKAERERQKQARNTQEALQSSQRGSQKTSKASIVKKRPARCGVGVRSHPKPATPPLPARTHTTCSSRTATLYK